MGVQRGAVVDFSTGFNLSERFLSTLRRFFTDTVQAETACYKVKKGQKDILKQIKRRKKGLFLKKEQY